MRNTIQDRARSRAMLFAAASALPLLFAGPAFGQASSPSLQSPNGIQTDTSAGGVAGPIGQTVDDAGTDIIVTGSRIRRAETDFPNPITSVTAAAIEQSGRTNLVDLLVQTPALLGSSTSADNSGSTAGFGTTGVNLLDLRNLGTNRTLTLVDGRRHVAGLPGTAAVDVNTIPVDLIERVDVLTGGTSAVYGADGVSGVVNFILKRNFEGISARFQSGISEEGDGGNKYGAVTIGKNFADGRGNVALAYEFNQDDRINSFARSFTGDPQTSIGLVRNPADIPDSPSVFDRVLFNNLRYADSSRNGAIDVDFDGIPDFTGDGAIYDRGTLLPGSGGLTQGGDSTPTAGYQGDLQPLNRRHVVNGLASFEISPALRLFGEGKYVKTHAFSVAQPTYDFYTYISPDNPFIPTNIAAVAPDGVLLSRDNYDLGIRGETVDRQTLRGVVGADGKISDHATYEVSYVYGRTRTRNQSDNNRLSDRYFAALDAVTDPLTGRPTCRSNLNPTGNIDPENFDQPAVTFTPGANSGCVPLNFFGENRSDPAAVAFATADQVSRSTITQQAVSGSISGDFGSIFTLPGGSVGFAVGAEYRRETSSSNPDAAYVQGLILDGSQILPESGKFDVKEVFGELNVPLMKNARFAETLSFGAAVRLSDYSTVGKTTTWSVNGVYAPIRDISFRGTLSQAVRAPNIGELFGATSGTFSFIDDPCDPQNVSEGTQFRAANCAATLQATGLTPTQIADFSPTSDPQATQSLPGRVGGNRDLSEETAKTWTAGVVFRPQFLRGLTASFDWYNIRIRGAINTPTAQELVELCVDQPTLANVYCANVQRDPASGYVNDYLVTPANVAAFRTSGADVKINYQFKPGNLGTFNLRLSGGYLDTLNFVPTVGADVDNDREEAFAPKYSATGDLTWTSGPVTVNYGINWFSKTRRYTTEQLGANPDLSDPKFFWYKEKWEHEMQVSFNVQDRFTFYAGANNLFDEKPDIAASSYPISALGRYLYAGARIKLGDIF
jgi:outer membrane receptor protein involved in Fe transport